MKEFEVESYGDKYIHSDHNIPGLLILENFITEQEQIHLIDQIDKGTWLKDLKRRVQHFGYKYDYRSRSINEQMRVADLPEWTNTIKSRFVEFKLVQKVPDQMIINEYLPGQGIANHIDCEPCFEDTIISLSLCSPVEMEFINFKTRTKLATILNPKSLLILKREARYNWTHGIPARKSDIINDKRIKRSRRISLTFRSVIL